MSLWGRRLFKIAAMASSGLEQNRGTYGIRFLVYHKVDGSSNLELNLSPQLFERHLKFLALTGSVITYERALHLLQEDVPLDRSFYVLTFDDGYQDFYTIAFPLLRLFQLPATVFVTTGFTDTGKTYPLQRINRVEQPASWEMLSEMCESGLVTIGGHTHTHPLMTGLTRDRIEEELTYPLQLFKDKLGIHVQHFAYPEAVWSVEVDELVRKHYRSAVVGGGRTAQPCQFDPFRIPRIPVRRSDGWWFFRAKAQGWLENEEVIFEQLRGSKLYDLYLQTITAK